MSQSKSIYESRSVATVFDIHILYTSSNEQKSTSTAKHMEWNEELFLRKTSDQNGYSFGRKIDFILKDSNNNELNAGEFKQKNVSEAVKISQQVKNVRDNAAILIENKKLAGGEIAVHDIDYIGDVGYM
ncbi:unnamed protein product [Mucor fragilis]